MDREKLMQIAELLDEVLGENEPSDEELGYDEDAIELYDCLHDLREAMRNVGLM